MKKHVLFLVGVAILLVLVATLLFWPRAATVATHEGSSPGDPIPVETDNLTGAGMKSAASAPMAPAELRPSSVQATSRRNESSESSAQRAKITAALQRFGKLYTDVGTLSWDETKALVVRRRHAGEELIDELAALGPGGARALAEMFSDVDARSKLLMVAALGRLNDPQASAVLNDLLKAEELFSVRREMVSSLGQRTDPASSAVLSDLVKSQSDARLRAAGVQALSGRAEALELLNDRIRSDSSHDVQLESIHVMGSLGTASAQQILADIAEGSLGTDLRQKAIQELVRSYGDRSFDVLKTVLQDPKEAIRETAVRAVARLQSERSVALLSQAAASDSSPAVRELARLYISQHATTE